MDPNETLKQARAAARDFERASAMSTEEMEAADRLLKTFTDLDEWLTKDGFYPQDWEGASDEAVAVAKVDGYEAFSISAFVR